MGTNVVFHVYFSKRLNPISLQFETIDLVSLDTNPNFPVSLTSIAAGRMSATYTPGVSLQPITTYYFQLATNFSDVAGNLGSGTYWYLTTGAGAVTTGPTVTISKRHDRCSREHQGGRRRQCFARPKHDHQQPSRRTAVPRPCLAQ